MLVAAGGPVVDANSHGQVPLDAQMVAPAFMVMAIIYFMGTISGAHLNPAVTLGFALRRNFPWKRVSGYLTAQVAGSVLAAAFLRLCFSSIAHLGATTPGAGVGARCGGH